MEKVNGDYIVSEDGTIVYACSLKCHKQLQKMDSNNIVNIHDPETAVNHGWNSDYSDPTKTSLAILLTWLTDEDNANTYLDAADSIDKDEVLGDKRRKRSQTSSRQPME